MTRHKDIMTEKQDEIVLKKLIHLQIWDKYLLHFLPIMRKIMHIFIKNKKKEQPLCPNTDKEIQLLSTLA